MRVFERTVEGTGHINIIEAVFKAGSEERIMAYIARKVDEIDKALLNNGTKVTISSERKLPSCFQFRRID
jgi:hypothetical protein